jgi:hypothetical protein
LESVQVTLAEFRIRVLKDEDISGRERCAVIHLLATAWRRELSEPRSVRRRDLFGSRIA